MTKRVLVATESKEIFNHVSSALLNGQNQLLWAKSGLEAMDVVKGKAQNQANEAILSPDLLVCDMQIQQMGGVAICYEIYLESEAGRIPKIPTILLLDREADIFLAKEVGVDYLLKPINALELKQLVEDIKVA